MQPKGSSGPSYSKKDFFSILLGSLWWGLSWLNSGCTCIFPSYQSYKPSRSSSGRRWYTRTRTGIRTAQISCREITHISHAAMEYQQKKWSLPPRDPSAPPSDPKAPNPKTLPNPEEPETPLNPRRTPLNWERSSAMGSIASRSRSRSRLELPFDPDGLLPVPEDLRGQFTVTREAGKW